jgi:hypothetical protein
VDTAALAIFWQGRRLDRVATGYPQKTIGNPEWTCSSIAALGHDLGGAISGLGGVESWAAFRGGENPTLLLPIYFWEAPNRVTLDNANYWKKSLCNSDLPSPAVRPRGTSAQSSPRWS